MFKDALLVEQGNVYPWHVAPDADGDAVIKVGPKFVHVKLPQQQFSLNDAYLLKQGWPKSWPLNPIAIDVDLQSLMARMLAQGSHDGNDDWPSEMEYDDLQELSPEEREFARQRGMTVKEMAIYNFYKVVLKEPPTSEDPNDILEDMSREDTFPVALKNISMYDAPAIREYLMNMSGQQRLLTLGRIVRHYSGKVKRKYDSNPDSDTLLQLYLLLHPNVPKPSKVRQLDTNAIMAKLISGDNFLKALSLMAKPLGLPSIMTIGMSELDRVRFLRNYIGQKWDRYVGLR